jgi:hypothetical protein
MNKILSIILVLGIISISCNVLKKETYNSAEDAFNKHNPEVSLNLYKKIVLNSKTMPEDKSKAREKMGYIFSRFYNNNDSALFYALQNLNSSHHYCSASGYLLQQGKFADAKKLCHKALELSANNIDSMESCEVFSNSILKYTEYNLQNKMPADSSLLSEAWE